MNFIFNNAANKYLNKPYARAIISGNNLNGEIKGEVFFYNTELGVIIETKIMGLKDGKKCKNSFYAMHIHDGNNCNELNDKYINVYSHYNPDGCIHPNHKGDLLPIVGNKIYSYSKILYDTFSPEEIIDKIVIIHDSFDDFTTQPSGNAGKMIACGVIKRVLY